MKTGNAEEPKEANEIQVKSIEKNDVRPGQERHTQQILNGV